jgi:hypothetical protein
MNSQMFASHLNDDTHCSSRGSGHFLTFMPFCFRLFSSVSPASWICLLTWSETIEDNCQVKSWAAEGGNDGEEDYDNLSILKDASLAYPNNYRLNKGISRRAD